jgi:nucleoside-diphosphate-sugar epimerase
MTGPELLPEFPRGRRIVVTGAAGFIGSNLTRALVERGAEVVGVDDFSTGRRENLDAIAERVHMHEADLAAPGVAEEALAGADSVLHFAAIPSVQRSVEDPLTTHRSCTDATVRLLLAAQKHRVRRVVIAASSSAYGDIPTLPKTETMRPEPLSPYAVSKLCQEHYARAFSTCYRVDTICLRFFNVFGPHQDPHSDYAAVIPKFIRLMIAGEAPTIHGDGRQSRDFTYVANVVEANLLAAGADREFGGAVCNIACGRQADLNELVAKLNAILGTDHTPAHGPPRKGDVRHSLADISRAREMLGYEPLVDLDEGLARTVAWIRDNG